MKWFNESYSDFSLFFPLNTTRKITLHTFHTKYNTNNNNFISQHTQDEVYFGLIITHHICTDQLSKQMQRHPERPMMSDDYQNHV